MYTNFSCDGELYTMEFNRMGDGYVIEIFIESISPRKRVQRFPFTNQAECVNRYRDILRNPRGYVYA